MILVVDVGYPGDGAKAVGILIADWLDENPVKTFVARIDKVEEYVSGEFYRRELPCIEAVIRQVSEPLACIVIDGYVSLGRDAAPGLGARLWEKLDRAIPVVGVAKNAIHDVPEEARVYRGGSTRPLYVTAAGMPLEEAKERVLHMSGKYRLPAILKLVDSISKEA